MLISCKTYNWGNTIFRMGKKEDISKLANAVGMTDIHFIRYEAIIFIIFRHFFGFIKMVKCMIQASIDTMYIWFQT